jgi:GABA permease
LLVSLTLTNLYSVKSFGEFEFWLASIKVAAIIAFLILAGSYILGLWPSVPASLANLSSHGGFAPHGLLPVLTGAVAATGFYFGAEVVTIAAAETAEPARAVARATNSVVGRTLLFYVGSIFLVVCLVPWDTDAITTPYVSALSAMGVRAAAQVMNAIILTAVLSALNSGLYASSRMLFALTARGDAPAGLAKLTHNGVPARALLLGTLAARPLRAARPLAAEDSNVGLSLSDVYRNRRHARDSHCDGIHSGAAHAIDLRRHQSCDPGGVFRIAPHIYC